jgi:hypothetical protein
MGLGYSAFGGQEWIRKLRPKPFFSRRKTPLPGSEEMPEARAKYLDLLQKQKVKYGNVSKNPARPIHAEKGRSYFQVLVLIFSFGLSAWILDLLFDLF